MFPWHDEYVNGRLRRQVAKGDTMFALRDELRAKITANDPAENAIVTHAFAHHATGSSQTAWYDRTKGPHENQLSSMPELPEVETVRQSLERHIVGQRILALDVGDYPAVLGGDPPEVVQARLQGRTITRVRRRAKYLFLDLDDGATLTVHLRMTGRLSAVSHDREPLRHQRLAIAFDSGLDLRFSDQRKFGRVIHRDPEELSQLDRSLGIEPLSRDFTAKWLSERLQRRPGRIKAVLLDQRLIAGLGNIYADEALFLSGIHPERRANSLDLSDVQRLHRQIREVLRSALERKGTTFSSFEDADGNQGEYAGALLVYGRGGKRRCPRCGTMLERTVVGGRGASFCPTCQPMPAETPSSE